MRCPSCGQDCAYIGLNVECANQACTFFTPKQYEEFFGTPLTPEKTLPLVEEKTPPQYFWSPRHNDFGDC